MEFEIGDADYNVLGSLENNVGSVEKDQSKEVLIPMDEEAAKESLVLTKITLKKVPLKTQRRKIWSMVTKKFIPKINNRQVCRLFTKNSDLSFGRERIQLQVIFEGN